MSVPVAEPVAPPVAVPVKAGKTSMLDLGHLLHGLKLLMLERNDVVYMKATWFVPFFYECLNEHVEGIMKELRERNDVSPEIVTVLPVPTFLSANAPVALPVARVAASGLITPESVALPALVVAAVVPL
jgi:hypothetical protein